MPAARPERAAAAAAEAPEAAPAAEEKSKGATCPNCGQKDMAEHGPENPIKVGCWHCDTCGSCWQPDLSDVRADTPRPAGWPKAEAA
ncbi:MAG TPA: hypothetical protein VFB50_15885 [Chloroflexota bacterium]|nr:hypothetical protein [Chloroflexota bacterium]